MTDQIDPSGFRANIGIILVRDSGELFLGRRPEGRGWQFPQGGVHLGETPEAALYRELKEEVGLDIGDVEVLGSTRSWLRYRLPAQYQRSTRPLCIGQKQRWFMLRFPGSDSRFRFDTTERPEFEGWEWVPYWAPVREVIHFKRRVYSRALHELAPLAFPQGLPPYPSWWTPDLIPPKTSSRRRRRSRGRTRR